jgi:hypothetical protein
MEKREKLFLFSPKKIKVFQTTVIRRTKTWRKRNKARKQIKNWLNNNLKVILYEYSIKQNREKYHINDFDTHKNKFFPHFMCYIIIKINISYMRMKMKIIFPKKKHTYKYRNTYNASTPILVTSTRAFYDYYLVCCW